MRAPSVAITVAFADTDSNVPSDADALECADNPNEE